MSFDSEEEVDCPCGETFTTQFMSLAAHDLRLTGKESEADVVAKVSALLAQKKITSL